MSLRLALLAFFLPAACAEVREARLAQDPSSAIPGERTPTAAELGLPSMGPVSLDQVVHAALHAHPAVVQARRLAEGARARVRAAESAFLPQVSVGGSAEYVNRKESPDDATNRFVSLGFDVSWLLFDFGRTSALARSAGQEWLAAQQDLRAAEVDAAFRARTAYFELLRQVQILEVATETVRQFEARLDQVRELVRVGSRIPYDQSKAEVDLGTAKLAEVQARNSLGTAQANVANAVGLAESVEWVPATDTIPPGAPAGFDAAWEEARRSQPLLAASAAREAAASALVDAQIAALKPSVSLAAGAAVGGEEFPLPWNVYAGPRIRWVPFDGFQNLASIEESVAALRAARADRAAAEQETWLAVRTAWLALGSARERLVLTALTRASAEENLVLAQGRFDVGKGTSIELTDAQQALALARAAEIQAKADEGIAASELARAVGAGVPEEEPIAPEGSNG